MNLEHNHKTIVYIILGVVAAAAWAVFIYSVFLRTEQVTEQNNVPVIASSGQITLTPEESAQKGLLLKEMYANQQQKPLTKQEVVSKEAALAKQLQAN